VTSAFDFVSTDLFSYAKVIVRAAVGGAAEQSSAESM
jgi:hypothetical protein